MYKNLLLAVVVGAVLMSAGTSEADNVWWKDWAATHEWNDRWNWETGEVPLATDTASFGTWGDPTIPGCVMPAGDDATIARLFIARYGGPSDVTVAGANLTVNGAVTLGDSGDWNCWGELRVHDGSVTAGDVELGLEGDGVLDMQGGTASLGQLWVALESAATTGQNDSTGTVKLDGGLLSVAGLHMSENPAGGPGGVARMSITGGVMTVDDVDGSVASQIESWVVNDNWIDGYGFYDLSHVLVSWDGVGTTTVSAVPEPATLALLGLGGLALLLRRRGR